MVENRLRANGNDTPSVMGPQSGPDPKPSDKEASWVMKPQNGWVLVFNCNAAASDTNELKPQIQRLSLYPEGLETMLRMPGRRLRLFSTGFVIV